MTFSLRYIPLPFQMKREHFFTQTPSKYPNKGDIQEMMDTICPLTSATKRETWKETKLVHLLHSSHSPFSLRLVHHFAFVFLLVWCSMLLAALDPSLLFRAHLRGGPALIYLLRAKKKRRKTRTVWKLWSSCCRLKSVTNPFSTTSHCL